MKLRFAVSVRSFFFSIVGTNFLRLDRTMFLCPNFLSAICRKYEESRSKPRTYITVMEVMDVAFVQSASAHYINNWTDLAEELGVLHPYSQLKSTFEPMGDLRMLLEAWVSYKGREANVSGLKRALSTIGLDHEASLLHRIKEETVVTFARTRRSILEPDSAQPSTIITLGNIQENPYIADEGTVSKIIEYFAGKHLKIVEIKREDWLCEVDISNLRPRAIRVTLVQNLEHFPQPLPICHLATELVAAMRSDQQFRNHGFTVDMPEEIPLI